MNTPAMQVAFERARVTKDTPARLITLCIDSLTRAHQRARRKRMRAIQQRVRAG